MIKLFTHTDLDGITCAIVAQLAYGWMNKKLEVEFLGYDQVNEKIGTMLDDLEYVYKMDLHPTSVSDTILITDLSVNEAIGQRIESFNNWSKRGVFKLFDHHPTADHLAGYSWATINSAGEACGASLLWDWFRTKYWNNTTDPVIGRMHQLVETTRLYDTWIWRKNGIPEPGMLNDLFSVLGRDAFIHMAKSYVDVGFADYSIVEEPFNKILIRDKQKKVDAYVTKALKNVRYDAIDLKLQYGIENVAIVFAEEYANTIADVVSEVSDVDMVMIVSPINRTVSLRSRKNMVDLASFARDYFGGGGHKQAAGFQLKDGFYELIAQWTLEIFETDDDSYGRQIIH